MTSKRLFLKGESVRSQHVPFCSTPLLADCSSTFGTRRIVHTRGMMTTTNPARIMNVRLQWSTLRRASTMELITNKPPPGPIARSPNANERLLTKYEGITRYVGKNTKHEPKPKKPPYVTKMMYMLDPCEVTRRAPEQIMTPIMVVVRGPTRLYTLATSGLKRPWPTKANDPAKAEEKIS